MPADFVALVEGFNRAAGNWPMVADHVCSRAADVGHASLVAAIEDANLIFRGRLLHSITATVVAEGKDADHRIVGHVTSDAWPEAIVMDLGRAPGGTFPSMNGLRGWATAKLGSFSQLLLRSGKARKVRGKNAEAEGRQKSANDAARQVSRLAFIIGRSIQKKGIKGRNFVRTAGQAVQAVLRKIADEETTTFLAETF